MKVKVKVQSRTESFIESTANIVAGVGIAFGSQLIIFHAYGIHVTLGTNAMMTCWFTVVSLVRQMVLRRLFNFMSERKLNEITPRWNNLTRDGRHVT